MYEKIGKLVVTASVLYIGYHISKYVFKKGLRAIDNQIDESIDRFCNKNKESE